MRTCTHAHVWDSCTLYYALCGKPPLWAETQTEVMRRIIRFDAVEEATYPEQVPGSLPSSSHPLRPHARTPLAHLAHLAHLAKPLQPPPPQPSALTPFHSP